MAKIAGKTKRERREDPRLPDRSGVHQAANLRNSAGRMRDRRDRRAKDARRDETRQEW